MAELIKICTCTIISVLVAIRPSLCANILVILPTSARSHLIIFESILQTLATEHEVTFYSVYPLNKQHTNITEHRFVPSYTRPDLKPLMQHTLNKDPQLQIISMFNHFSVKHFNYVLSQDTFQQLLNSTKKYEVFITSNVLGEPFFKFSHALNVSLVVQISVSLLHPWTNADIGNDNNLAHGMYFLSKDVSTNFFSRITNFVNHMYVWLYYEWLHLPNLEYNIQKHFPQNTPTIKQIVRQTQGVLLNIVSPMGYAQANSPNVHEFGGLQCHPPKPLSTELENFISGSGQHGFIYFSLGGTFINSQIAKLKGYGRVLKFNQFTEEIFRSNIEEIILNEKYKNKAKQTSEAMRDHCDGNADRLKRFINYLIKHKDSSPLRPITKPQSQIHLMQLDIYAFILCILAICFIIIKYIFKKLYNCITDLYYFRLNKVKVI
ncbi:UDP-glycosyltransferase family 35 member C1 [Carabus blaptoides fortunei]